MLNPNSRSLYTSALAPPPGMIFDEAVATTFSMNPALLLEAPVYLALMANDGQTNPDPLAVLEAIRRYSKRITVYVQRGQIQIPQTAKPNPLFGFLENMVVEVSAPGGGVFHPKVWAIRFVSPDQGRVMYRLVVLSRNMTPDQSWDLSLQLEGSVIGRKTLLNKPLAHFFGMLPGLANGALTKEREAQAHRFAEALHRVQWELPEGFDELAFYLPGIKGFDWEPPVVNRLAIISPFCSDHALKRLAGRSRKADALISRPESLSALKPETLALFTRSLQLDDAAETEDGEESTAADQPLARGLHAKVYLFETRYYSDYTHVIMGSANATNAALNSARNIEILVGLIGRKSKVGGIDELLGADGLGEYLVDFDVSKESDVDAARQAAEVCVDDARYRLANAALSLECIPASKESLWSLLLLGEVPSLEGIVSAEVWPITLHSDSRATSLLSSEPVMWECDAAYVTSFIAFDLKTNHPDVSARFVLSLPITGIPEARDSAILQTVISNKEGFIRYLLLLLAADTAQGLNGGDAAGWAKWLARLAAGEDVSLLEELTRTFSRHPERLSEVSRLVKKLAKSADNEVVPDEFLGMWSVFESALGVRDAK